MKQRKNCKLWSQKHLKSCFPIIDVSFSSNKLLTKIPYKFRHFLSWHIDTALFMTLLLALPMNLSWYCLLIWFLFSPCWFSFLFFHISCSGICFIQALKVTIKKKKKEKEKLRGKNTFFPWVYYFYLKNAAHHVGIFFFTPHILMPHSKHSFVTVLYMKTPFHFLGFLLC